jgi:hypothetical protein
MSAPICNKIELGHKEPLVKEERQISEDVFKHICDRIAEGENLNKISQEDGMPTKSSFLRMCNVLFECDNQYVWAMEIKGLFKGLKVSNLADSVTQKNV